MTFYLKDPRSEIDYAIDWGSGYLDGQTILSSTWSVTPGEADGLALGEESFDLTRTAVRLTGGISGHVYSVSNLVALSDGTLDERSISLRVEER